MRISRVGRYGDTIYRKMKTRRIKPSESPKVMMSRLIYGSLNVKISLYKVSYFWLSSTDQGGTKSKIRDSVWEYILNFEIH
jgi:hypothetical protein